MRLTSLILALLLGVALCAVSALAGLERDAMAQSRSEGVYVPPALEAWVPWVMAAHDDLSCAAIQDTFVCDWPGKLDLEVEATQGRFTLEVWRDIAGEVALPGGDRFWPQQVEVGGAPLVVMQHADSGAPRVRLPAGRSTITGRFTWKTMPEVVQLPGEVAMVSLTLEQERVLWPRIDAQGRLWVKEAGGGSEGEADTVRGSIYRQLSDGVPFEIATAIELNVAGRAREVSLGKPLIDKAIHVGVSGPLPVKIAPDGEVRVYVRPGTHRITVSSYLTAPFDTLVVPERPAPFFDPVEYWVWRPDEALRSVELTGLLTIDAARTTLPEEWRGGTTFNARPGDTLSLATMRQGEVDQSPNQLTLTRKLWLDLDGTGYTASDRLNGTLNQGWRLNYGADAGKLGRVKMINNNEDLLITGDVDQGGLEGVELRESALALEAEVRLPEHTRELPIVGWEHDVQSLSVELAMPPGWSVLAVSGVDDVSTTWIDSWDLFELFVLLMIAFAMGRLFGWPWGVLSAVAMLLSHGQDDAPRYVWFHLVAVLALLRVLPDKLWLRIPALTYLAVSFITLITLFGFYAHEQVRVGLHPQVASSGSFQGGGGFFLGDAMAPPMGAEYEKVVASEIIREEQSLSVVSKLSRSNVGKNSDYGWQQLQQQIDPKEVVQTGPGLPDWSWNTWYLSWTGPVAHDHHVRLWLLSPRWNLLIRFLSVLAFLAMALVVISPRRFATRQVAQFDLYKALKRLVIPVVLGGVGALLFTLPAPREAMAQGVDAATLSELERRLVAESDCEGPCLVTSQMTLTLSEEQLIMEAEVHAQREVAWGLPGDAALLALEEVRLDGEPTVKLRRELSGMRYLRVPRGRHVVTLRARLNAQNVITLQLDPQSPPHHVQVRAEGWTIDGVDEFGRPDASLQLSRVADAGSVRQDDSVEVADSQQELPSWFRVERALLLGLPWQSRTTIVRQDGARPQLVKIPLLAGEAVISEGIRVEQGMALVNFARDQTEVSYLSEIALPAIAEGSAGLTLTAPTEQPWSEVWELECSRVWRCNYDGLVPVQTLREGVFRPRWRPWPGERVEIQVRKPRGVQGAASTITRVDYEVSPGQRRLQATLNITLRASQGGWQRVELPAGAELQEVKINEQVRNIRPEGQNVSLPIVPGEQRYLLTWIQDWDRGVIERFPVVKLGGEAVNVNLRMNVGPNRWLLWTFGPDWGPAVLFWSHFLLLLLCAVVLGRLRHLPLRTHHWLLLALGMSQLPLVMMLVLVAWFSLLVWRRERPLENSSAFNLLQLVIIGATLVFLGVLYAAVHTNLLFDVDMQVRGQGSHNTMLNWYVDRVEGELPTAGVLSLPLLVWRGAMLLWALWLASSLVRWMPWAWRSFGSGQLWKPFRTKTPATDASVPEQEEPVAPPIAAQVRSVESAADGTPDAPAAEDDER